MKFNKIIKIFLTIMMITLMIVFTSQTVFATGGDEIDVSTSEATGAKKSRRIFRRRN